MKIAFRTDASSQIGTGHFMRCLTLAEELKKQDIDVCFISRNLPTHLNDMLSAKDVKYIPLNADDTKDLVDDLAHSSWLGISQAQDAQATVEALAGQVYDWMVVDHYALDVRWESIVRPNVKKIMVIDDLADRHHDCDVLLDQNYYADMQTRYKDKVPSHCQLLLGPSYALLREEFRALREQVKVRNGEVKKVLVFFGGVDADNYSNQTIEALAEIDAKLQVDVVIGAQHPFKEMIESACESYGYVCHVQTQHMAKLMANADLAIGAGGSTILERCALALPSIVIVMANNQCNSVKDLDAIGALVSLGDAQDVTKLHLIESIKKLLSDSLLRISLSSASFDLMLGCSGKKLLNIFI
jgi:UDP-2,4-diacetamido-2,4,6-trideoxy-beta-L-altropyranose hydrolase